MRPHIDPAFFGRSSIRDQTIGPARTIVRYFARGSLGDTAPRRLEAVVDGAQQLLDSRIGRRACREVAVEAGDAVAVTGRLRHVAAVEREADAGNPGRAPCIESRSEAAHREVGNLRLFAPIVRLLED